MNKIQNYSSVFSAEQQQSEKSSVISVFQPNTFNQVLF